MLHFQSRAEPGIRLAVGPMEGSRRVNITAFALGRRDEKGGAEVLSLAAGRKGVVLNPRSDTRTPTITRAKPPTLGRNHFFRGRRAAFII